MEFSWDPNKRLKTIEDRALDFADAVDFFNGRPVVHQATPRHNEARWKSTTVVESRLFTIVWLWRGEKRHII